MAAMDQIWLIQSETDNEFVHNPVMERMCLDGGLLAKKGMWSRSTGNQTISDVFVRFCTEVGLLIDDGNGVISRYGYVQTYRYLANNNPAVSNSSGLEIDSVGRFSAVTRGTTNWSFADLLLAPGPNGEGLIVGDCDSTYFGRVQGSSIRLKGDRPATLERLALRASRKNTFSHLAADVYAEDGSITTVHSINSEPTRQIILEDDAIFQFDNLINRQTGADYQTRRFTMNRPMVLGVPDSSLSRADIANNISAPEIVYRGNLKVEAIRLPADDENKTALWTVCPPDDYDDGVFSGIVLRYFADAQATTDIVLELTMRTMSEDQFAGNVELVETITIPNEVLQNDVYKTFYFSFPSNIAYKRHDITTLSLKRPAGQNNTGDFDLIGVELQYASEGPIDGANQQYDSPKKVQGDLY